LKKQDQIRPKGRTANPKEGQMYRNTKRGEKGFTLIELMIVVVIIGILAALAIPRFMRATTKSKQSEAKQVLKQIYTMQHAYRQEYNTYWGNGTTASAAAPTAFGRIGVDIMTTARYTYSLVAAANTFTCTATSGVLDDDATADTWTIDENGDLLVTSDDAVS
jgi:prepilin-type N-terminal cleavage/methylation domain-containing protein